MTVMNADKLRASEALSAQLQQYLANGGSIKVLKPGKAAL